jgi:hypothetical protein
MHAGSRASAGSRSRTNDKSASKAEEQCQKDGGNWDAKTKTCSGNYRSAYSGGPIEDPPLCVCLIHLNSRALFVCGPPKLGQLATDFDLKVVGHRLSSPGPLGVGELYASRL